MIDPKKHMYHVEALGSIEEFNEMIDYYHFKAPWLSDDEIEAILDDEAKNNVGPSFWFLNG